MAKIPTLDLRPNPRKVRKRRKAKRSRKKARGGYVIELMLKDSYGMRPFAYLGKGTRAERGLSKAQRFSTEKAAMQHGRKQSKKLGANWDGLRVVRA